MFAACKRPQLNRRYKNQREKLYFIKTSNLCSFVCARCECVCVLVARVVQF